MSRINKPQLIEAISADLGLPKSVVGSVVDRMIAAIEAATEAGDTVAIQKFGAFELKRRPARLGRNPKTGETIAVPESAALRFRPARRVE